MRPMSNNPSGIEPPKSVAKTAAPQSPLQFFFPKSYWKMLNDSKKGRWSGGKCDPEASADVTPVPSSLIQVCDGHRGTSHFFFWFPNLQRTLGISRVKVEVWDVDINQWHHVAQGFRSFFLRCWVGPAMVSVGFYCLRPEQACQCIFLVCLGLHSPSTILCVPKWCGSWKV